MGRGDSDVGAACQGVLSSVARGPWSVAEKGWGAGRCTRRPNPSLQRTTDHGQLTTRRLDTPPRHRYHPSPFTRTNNPKPGGMAMRSRCQRAAGALWGAVVVAALAAAPTAFA